MLPIFTWETSSQGPVTIDIIHLWFHVAVLWCRDAWLCWLSWCCCKCSMAVIVISIDMLLYVYVDEKKTNVYYEKAVVADDWDENQSPKQSINHRQKHQVHLWRLTSLWILHHDAVASRQSLFFSRQCLSQSQSWNTCSIIMTVNIIKHHDLRVLKYYIFFWSQSIEMFHSITMQCTGFQTITSHHVNTCITYITSLCLYCEMCFDYVFFQSEIYKVN